MLIRAAQKSLIIRYRLVREFGTKKRELDGKVLRHIPKFTWKEEKINGNHCSLIVFLFLKEAS